MYGAWGDYYLKPPPPKSPRPKKPKKEKEKKEDKDRPKKMSFGKRSRWTQRKQTKKTETDASGSPREIDIRSREDESSLQLSEGTLRASSSQETVVHPPRLDSLPLLDREYYNEMYPSEEHVTQHDHDSLPLNDLDDSARHVRVESLHVNWTLDDVQRMAQEIQNETIADVHLSLFAFWILDKTQNYELAKTYIRELKMDQVGEGYNVDRIQNTKLRQLLLETWRARPVEPPHAKQVQKTLSMISKRSSTFSLDRDAAPRSAKPAALPSRLRAEQALTMQPSATLSTLTSPTREYPPNTPDRPAPLSLRSRSSSIKTCCTVGPLPQRSVSTPLHGRHREDIPPLPHSDVVPRNTLLWDETVSHPLLTPTRAPGQRARDVMDAADGADAESIMTAQTYDTHELLGMFPLPPGQRESLGGAGNRSASMEYSMPHYSLDSADLSDDAPSVVHNDDWSTLDSYIGSSDEEWSDLEDSSTVDEEQDRVVYAFGPSGPPPGEAPPRLPREAMSERLAELERRVADMTGEKERGD